MSPFLQLPLTLVIMIVAAKAGGWISVRLRQPAVLGELLAGLVLGPTVIDLIHLPFVADPHLLGEEVANLAEIGVVFLMFVAGMEVDLREMAHAGRVATFSGILGVIVPLLFGALTALPFGYEDQTAWFMGIILTATSVSISAQTLLELNVLRTREGIALLGAAVIDAILVLILLSISLAFSGGAGEIGSVVMVAVNMLLYLALAGGIGWFVLPRLAQ